MKPNNKLYKATKTMLNQENPFDEHDIQAFSKELGISVKETFSVLHQLQRKGRIVKSGTKYSLRSPLTLSPRGSVRYQTDLFAQKKSPRSNETVALVLAEPLPNTNRKKNA